MRSAHALKSNDHGRKQCRTRVVLKTKRSTNPVRVGHASRRSHATPFYQPRAKMNPDLPVRRVRRALWNPELADLVLLHLVKASTISVTHSTPFHQPREQMNPGQLVCSLRLVRRALWNPDLADLILRHLVKASTLSVTHATPSTESANESGPPRLFAAPVPREIASGRHSRKPKR
jgi:hypothetical protein